MMRAVPVASCGGHAGGSLEATAALMEALEIIAAGAVDEEDEGLGALGDEVEGAGVGG